MTVTIGKLKFDHATYDSVGDVLYLHVGEPCAAAEAEETPEGHVVRFDESGRVLGLTILNARWLLDRDGAVTVTAPNQNWRAEGEELAEVLGLSR